jgi:hypothetical protein
MSAYSETGLTPRQKAEQLLRKKDDGLKAQLERLRRVKAAKTARLRELRLAKEASDSNRER